MYHLSTNHYNYNLPPGDWLAPIAPRPAVQNVWPGRVSIWSSKLERGKQAGSTVGAIRERHGFRQI